jgi:hypothetical protein
MRLQYIKNKNLEKIHLYLFKQCISPIFSEFLDGHPNVETIKNLKISTDMNIQNLRLSLQNLKKIIMRRQRYLKMWNTFYVILL